MLKINISNDVKRAMYGGGISAMIIAIGIFYIGNLSEHEAKVLWEKSIPGFNMLCNTIVLASATIMALLLTLLGISTSSKSHLKSQHYQQVSLLAKGDAMIFIVAIIMFQFSNIPMTEAENFPQDWFSILYWFMLIVSSLLCGGIISIILMLYNTITNIIHIVGLGIEDHPLIDTDE